MGDRRQRATHASPLPTRGERRSIRLKDYDYSMPGAYFVTVCAYNKQMLFGEINNERVDLSGVGKIVEACWLSLPDHFDYVILDEFVIMPNHFHRIVFISGSTARVNGVVGARHASPEGDPAGTRDVAPTVATGCEVARCKGDACVAPTGPRPRSLAALIGSFKAAATKQVHDTGHCLGSPVWQRNYYEHIVRNDDALTRIRGYVLTNALRWELDCENPARKNADKFDAWLSGFRKRPRRTSPL